MSFANSLSSAFLMMLLIAHDCEQTSNKTNIEVLYQWTYPDFLYSTEEARSKAISQHIFIPENVVTLDSDYYISLRTLLKRVFVTTPRFRPGTPATLSEVSEETTRNGEHLLKPFPSWRDQGEDFCKSAVSVYRIHIDECGLLWVLDSGIVDGFLVSRRACRPKLLIYNLNEGDRLIVRYEFPDGVINDRSNLITLVTESYQDGCLDSIAYIADVEGYGLVVFDLTKRASWRVDHQLFYPFPSHGTATVANVTFDLMDGVFGLALGPGHRRDRKLYFHSFASVRESWVPVAALKDNMTVQDPNLLRKHFTLTDGVRPGQSTLEVMTDDGVLLFSLIPQTAVACWNTDEPFTEENIHIIYQDAEKLQFISGMKLKGGKTLLITSSRLQNYMIGNFNYPGVKYRILVIHDVYELINATTCAPHGSREFIENPQRPLDNYY